MNNRLQMLCRVLCQIVGGMKAKRGSPSVRSGCSVGWSDAGRTGGFGFGGGAGGIDGPEGVASTRWIWPHRFLDKKEGP
jgi:hypothetical protein